MSFAVITVVELADWSLGVGTVVGLTTTAWVEAEVVGPDGRGAVVTESEDGTLICGSGTAAVDVAPGVDGGFAAVSAACATLGLGFASGVAVGAAA